jgi:hypothetical protein
MKRPSTTFIRRALSVSVSMALLQMSSAMAQTTAPAAPAAAEKADNSAPLNLDQVVITASPVSRTKMKSTDSPSPARVRPTQLKFCALCLAFVLNPRAAKAMPT